MKTTFALAALAAVAFANPMPQGVNSAIAPTGSAPAGFQSTYPGTFEITAVNYTTASKRSLEKRTCNAEGSLTISLANGVLTDAQGRTGYIAANYQFQFDKPPQTGAIYTAGFSVGSNNSLALGASAVFYECLSGTFYNLYDRSWAPQCYPILIQVLPCASSSTGPVITQSSDGQPAGTSVATQITDGQPQVATALPISEISDGQPQIPTGKPGCAVTQIKDGQVQVTSCAPTSTAAPITQISDGQPQAPTSTAAPITQISDGQPQAPTSTAAPITQISDGQPQAPTSKAPTTTSTSLAPITQISDGQPQAPTATQNATKPATTSSIPFTGFAPALSMQSQVVAGVVGFVAVMLL